MYPGRYISSQANLILIKSNLELTIHSLDFSRYYVLLDAISYASLNHGYIYPMMPIAKQFANFFPS